MGFGLRDVHVVAAGEFVVVVGGVGGDVAWAVGVAVRAAQRKGGWSNAAVRFVASGWFRCDGRQAVRWGFGLRDVHVIAAAC